MIDIFLAGGPVMYPLLLCSVVTLGIILDRSRFWLILGRSRRPDLVAALCQQSIADSGKLPDSACPDVIGRVLVAGLQGPKAELTWNMQQAAVAEVYRVARYQGILDTMVSLAPLLGIFGTVLGIIESFQLLGDASLLDPLAASGGLAQALITTAFGLAIAMPSLVAYKIFDAKTVRLEREIEARCTEVEMSFDVADVVAG